MTKLKKSLPYIALLLAIILQYYYAYSNPVTYSVTITNKNVAETGNNG